MQEWMVTIRWVYPSGVTLLGPAERQLYHDLRTAGFLPADDATGDAVETVVFANTPTRAKVDVRRRYRAAFRSAAIPEALVRVEVVPQVWEEDRPVEAVVLPFHRRPFRHR